jgi:DNA-binding NtrC family response regulator
MRYEDARQAALDRFERCYLGALLDHHGNSATDAARAAGMSRSHLYRMLTKHGLR